MRIHEVHRVRTAVVFAVAVEARHDCHARMNSSSPRAFQVCRQRIVFVEERGIHRIAVEEEAKYYEVRERISTAYCRVTPTCW